MNLPEQHLHHLKKLRDPEHRSFADFHFKRSQELGWPTRLSEGWKYTSLKSLKDSHFVASTNTGDSADLSEESRQCLKRLANLQLPHFLTLNGRITVEPELSRAWPRGISVRPSSAFITTESATLNGDFFDHLNQAFADFSLDIVVSDDLDIELPLLITHWVELGSNPAIFVSPLVRIFVGKSSRVTIVEGFGGQSGARYFVNARTEIYAGRDSEVHYITHSLSSQTSSLMTRLKVDLQAGAQIHTFALSGPAALQRCEFNYNFLGEECEAHHQGTLAGGDKQTLDMQVAMSMQQPNGKALQIVRSLLGGASTGVYTGKVHIARDAQLCDSTQLSQSLLLTDQAEMNTKPELDIFADNVKASHGASIGQLDEDEVFYLQSRGMDRQTAETLLANGFLSHMISEIEHHGLKAFLLERANELYQMIVRRKWMFDPNSQL